MAVHCSDSKGEKLLLLRGCKFLFVWESVLLVENVISAMGVMF